MNDPVANTQLELACRLGVLDDVIEALDDGANIDCNGSAPLFFAVENGDRDVLGALVDRGADVAIFEVDRSADLVEQLLKIGTQAASASASVDGGANGGGDSIMVELDAKMIRAFDRMLRNKGIAEPIAKGRWAEYRSFCDGLTSLAAEECQSVVSEFLGMVGGDDEGAAKAFAAAEENAEGLAGLSGRYAAATAEELPGDLLKEYLKESKKLNK